MKVTENGAMGDQMKMGFDDYSIRSKLLMDIFDFRREERNECITERGGIHM